MLFQQVCSKRRLNAAALALALPLLASGQRADLLNPWEIHAEIAIDRSAAPAVKQNLLSFLDYQDLVMFHPTLGYYASGRVDFDQDYRTFPDALAPRFGQMIVEHIFQMWQGMRKAGTLNDTERFTIAEFGAGDGALAESILEYVDSRAASGGAWQDFARQLVYACYDRSPALSAAQRKRNSRFGSRFEAREGDATDPGATIPAGSLKGVVLSNELPDAFSVHKVILSPAGSAEVGFVAPELSPSSWSALAPDMPAELQARLKTEDAAIQSAIFGSKRESNVLLGPGGFVALLQALSPSADYQSKLAKIEFHEVYVPVETVPELAEHIRRYIPAYAYELSRANKSFAGYINLGEGRFMQGMGKILKAGYVITIDYGENWDTITPLEFDHFRAYGPGSTTEHSNPYHAPTLNDMTTDVNFSHMMEEGKAAGLRPVFFGPQHALLDGTPIDLNVPPANRDAEDYQSWVQSFHTWDVYKILIEQKENTDPAYSFPGTSAEPLTIDLDRLTADQRQLASDIEKRLQEGLTASRP